MRCETAACAGGLVVLVVWGRAVGGKTVVCKPLGDSGNDNAAMFRTESASRGASRETIMPRCTDGEFASLSESSGRSPQASG